MHALGSGRGHARGGGGQLHYGIKDIEPNYPPPHLSFQAGLCKLIWDNTYSWINPKKLIYSVELVPGGGGAEVDEVRPGERQIDALNNREGEQRTLKEGNECGARERHVMKCTWRPEARVQGEGACTHLVCPCKSTVLHINTHVALPRAPSSFLSINPPFAPSPLHPFPPRHPWQSRWM